MEIKLLIRHEGAKQKIKNNFMNDKFFVESI